MKNTTKAPFSTKNIKEQKNYINALNDAKDEIAQLEKYKDNINNRITILNNLVTIINNMVHSDFFIKDDLCEIEMQPIVKIETQNNTEKTVDNECTTELSIYGILQKEGVVLLNDIYDVLISEHNYNKITIDELNVIMTKKCKKGEVIFGKYNNAEYTFYALPHFLDVNKKIKNENYPKNEYFTRHSIDKIKFNEINWNFIAINSDTSNGNTIEEIDNSYPKEGKQKDKLKHIIKERNCALKSSDFKKEIIKHEGNSFLFYQVLYSLDKENILSASKINKHVYYILPEFLDSNGFLKKEHYSKDFNKTEDINWNKINKEQILN